MPGAYIELCMHLAEEWPIFGLFLLLGNNGTHTIVCLAPPLARPMCFLLLLGVYGAELE